MDECLRESLRTFCGSSGPIRFEASYDISTASNRGARRDAYLAVIGIAASIEYEEETSANKSDIIIGASRGLGLAIVEDLLERGWRVVGTCRHGKPTQLHALAERFPDMLEIERIDITRSPRCPETGRTLA